ncbi:MAG TPA: hypothetical protein VNR68_05330 [Sphingomicrobium sp.]|nr:hypothetical protein [Sphingomicrobium sp.]
MSEQPEWFAAKRWGYGAGLPISWQGWAVSIAFILITIVLVSTLGDDPLGVVASIILPTAAFVVITVRTTRSGWRWRWGEDD